VKNRAKDMEIKVPDNELLVFIDDTGHEQLSDKNYPVIIPSKYPNIH
jgi:hypothetical protein